MPGPYGLRVRQPSGARTVGLYQMQEIARPRNRHDAADAVVNRRRDPDRLGPLGASREHELLCLDVLKLAERCHGAHVDLGEGDPVNPIWVAGPEELRGGVATNGGLSGHAPMITRHVGLEQHGGDAQLQRGQRSVFTFDVETLLHI